MSYATRYFEEMRSILDQLDPADLDRMAEKLALVRERGGRLFFIGGMSTVVVLLRRRIHYHHHIKLSLVYNRSNLDH